MAVFSLGIAVIIEGGHLSSLLSLPAFVIVIGGTIGATVIGFTMKELKNVPTLIRIGFMGKDFDPTDMIRILVRFAEKARREGLLALEEELSSVDNDFVRKGMQLVIDGTDAELVRSILETELNLFRSVIIRVRPFWKLPEVMPRPWALSARSWAWFTFWVT